MNVQFLKEITNPEEIVDKNKYKYYFERVSQHAGDKIWIAQTKQGAKIQDSFSNTVGGTYIKVYKELINKTIIKRSV